MIAEELTNSNRRLARGILVVLLLLSTTSCKNDEHWTDEVLLHDGRTTDVQRTVAFHFGGGELSELGKQWPDQYALTTRNVDTGKTVHWSGGRNFNPILLDFLGKTPYLVIVATSIYSDLKQYGCPEIPYIFFRYNEGNGRWSQISASEFPQQLALANLSYSYDARFIEGTKRQTKEDVQSGNRTHERFSSAFTTAIPTDFASWQSRYKNQYRVGHYHDGCRHTVPSNEDLTHPQSPTQPSQKVNLEILETKVFDPEWVVKPDPVDPGRNWAALAWDQERNAKCQALVKQAGDDSNTPGLRGWLLFVNDPTGSKKAQAHSDMFCDDRALWFLDYTAEAGRVVLVKFTIAGDFVYRLSFQKPDELWGFSGHIMYPTFRSEGGDLSFEWWNTKQSGNDRSIRRSMKVKLREPVAAHAVTGNKE